MWQSSDTKHQPERQRNHRERVGGDFQGAKNLLTTLVAGYGTVDHVLDAKAKVLKGQ
ncbi:hypothetical protein D3C81_1981720 [compost metagenome]